MTYQRTPLQIALRKRKEALNSIEVHKRWLEKLTARVRELDGVIKELGGAPPPKKQVIDFRAKGELSRTMFDLLRRRGSLTAEDLAAVMLKAYRLDAADKAVAHAMRQRCAQAFRRAERKGLVRAVGWSESKTGRREHGRFVRWALAAPPTNRAMFAAVKRG